jgi:M6 family metalloprotease-like protein
VWVALLLFVVAAAALGSWVRPSPAGAAPVSGNTPWAILRCQFSDQAAPPLPDSFYNNFFTASGAGQGGLYDYWNQVSYGAISLQGTTVFPWVPLGIPSTQDTAGVTRHQQIQRCIDAAAKQNVGDLSHFYGIFVIQSNVGGEGEDQTAPLNVPACNMYGCTTQQLNIPGVIFEYNVLNLTNASHEMGHGYGLNHAWDTQQTQFCGGTQNPAGAYCDVWDTMGAPANAPALYGLTTTFVNPNFGPAQGSDGPGLDAPHLDMLGWIAPDRIYTYSGQPAEITLHPLEDNGLGGYLMAKVPIGANPAQYYTIEYRRAVGVDAGLQDQIVMIHLVGTITAGGSGATYLVDNAAGSTTFTNPALTVGQSYTDTVNNLRISVFETGLQATVDIGPANISSPPVPANLRVGMTGISTNGVPGFIDLQWDDSSTNVGNYRISTTGPFTSQPPTSTEYAFTQGNPQTYQFSAEQIVQASSWTFEVQACTSYVCSPWSAPLTVTMPSGGGGGGGGGGGSPWPPGVPPHSHWCITCQQ